VSAGAAAAKTIIEYLAATPEAQRSDAQRLHKLIRKTAPALKPFVGFGMIGYGPLHVRYTTGREVDWFVVGHRFPKSDVGKSCVRFKKLAHLDETAVVALVRAAQRARKTWVSE
jgi:hypothetical protein